MKKIVIEYLYPEVCNLYGDTFNVRYLEESVALTNEVEVVHTALTDEPRFVKGDVDFIYMGSMSERTQEIVINKLKPYKDRIIELIDKGCPMLFTGNAIEIFGEKIEGKNKAVSGLGITGLTAKRDMLKRYNTLYLGKMDGLDSSIMGHKAVFSFSYGDNKKCYAFHSIRGCGINKESEYEGFRKNNFLATYLIGPLFILNPDLLRKYMKDMGVEKPCLKFEKEMDEIYKIRLREFESEKTNFLQ